MILFNLANKQVNVPILLKCVVLCNYILYEIYNVLRCLKGTTDFSKFVPGAVEIHYSSTVMPRNAARRCTLHVNSAHEAYRTTLLYVDVLLSHNLCLSSCNTQSEIVPLKIFCSCIRARRLINGFAKDRILNLPALFYTPLPYCSYALELFFSSLSLFLFSLLFALIFQWKLFRNVHGYHLTFNPLRYKLF